MADLALLVVVVCLGLALCTRSGRNALGFVLLVLLGIALTGDAPDDDT